MRLLIPTSSRWSWPTRGLAADFESETIEKSFAEFDRLVDSLLQPTYLSNYNFQPRAEVDETDSHYLISFEMPGVKKEDIKIEMRGNQMSIAGERRLDQNHVKRKNAGKFERTFTLPESVHTEKIEAQYEDGVLSIALPKVESAKPRTIEIQGGGFLNKLLGPRKEHARELKDAKPS